jgi:hypothetical protein
VLSDTEKLYPLKVLIKASVLLPQNPRGGHDIAILYDLMIKKKDHIRMTLICLIFILKTGMTAKRHLY